MVREFWITIVAYMPAALAMLVAYVLNRRAGGGEVLRWGIAGVALTFVAAIVQVGRVALHPHWFNHNALYHTIQAVALLAIAVAAGARLGKSDGDRHAAGQ